jgi:arylsulfatase A
VLDDGYKDLAVEKLGAHEPVGPFRGGKYSVWEGGTRTPFITYWKGKIKSGVSNEVVCTVDLAASLAGLTGQSLAPEGCLDSFDISQALLGESNAKGRDHLLQQDNGSGNFGLREGDWKLVRLKQRGKSQATVSKQDVALPTSEYSLYRLSDDPGERHDMAAENPEVVQRMKTRLDSLIKSGRSRP